MFENKIIRGIHISRYVASWVKSGGTLACRGKNDAVDFRRWLKSLIIDGERLTDEEVRQVYNYATNGKLELEEDAKRFIVEKVF